MLQVAQLGVTENDWRTLAMAAAAALQLPEAVSAYRHLGDDQGLALMSGMEAELLGGASMDLCTAKILRYQVLLSFIAQLKGWLIRYLVRSHTRAQSAEQGATTVAGLLMPCDVSQNDSSEQATIVELTKFELPYQQHRLALQIRVSKNVVAVRDPILKAGIMPNWLDEYHGSFSVQNKTSLSAWSTSIACNLSP